MCRREAGPGLAVWCRLLGGKGHGLPVEPSPWLMSQTRELQGRCVLPLGLLRTYIWGHPEKWLLYRCGRGRKWQVEVGFRCEDGI